MKQYVLATSESVDMPSLKEAMKSPDKDKWMAACLEEIRSHTENGSWKLVELPEGASLVPDGCSSVQDLGWH
jgi:hypothetical protein